jgi:hypothetical protein
VRKKRPSTIPFLLFILFPLLLMSGGLILCFNTKQFNVANIRSNLTYNDYWTVDPLTDSQHEILTQILSKPYHYFGSGPHYYSFIDSENQYVIKFFKKNRLSPREWLERYPLYILRYFGYEEMPDNQFLSEHLFTNYKHAYESFRQETALFYLHLNKHREFKNKLHIIDAKGCSQQIDLNSCEFVIQRRADHLFDHLDILATEHRLKDFKNAIHAILRLTVLRCEKGFACTNAPLYTYLGFVAGEPVQYDCAILTKDLSMKYPFNIRQEVILMTDKLSFWSNEKFPHLTSLIQEEAAHILATTLPQDILTRLTQDHHPEGLEGQE